MMETRLKKLKKSIDENNLNAVLISSPTNSFYYTGFDKPNPPAGGEFRSIWPLVTPKTNYILTNPLHLEAVKKHFRARGENVQIVDITDHGGLSATLQNIINNEGIKTLGFEARDLKHAEFNKIISSLRSLKRYEKLVEVDKHLSQIRMIKEESEIKSIKKAQAVTDKAFKYLREFIKPGMKELDIALEVEYFMRKNGAEDKSFDPIVASGPNSAIPHHKSSN